MSVYVLVHGMRDSSVWPLGWEGELERGSLGGETPETTASLCTRYDANSKMRPFGSSSQPCALGQAGLCIGHPALLK